ncbi:MAG: hypothetical protein FF85_01790 [alpha proteobacterium QL1]|nr:MAG: hypothetical protein FF85_01790 [alpha proteobacterium QL1]
MGSWWFCFKLKCKKNNQLNSKIQDTINSQNNNFFIYVTAIIGFLDLIKYKLITAAPIFQDYYIAKEKIILEIIAILQQ